MQKKDDGRYQARGVSASKHEVHHVVEKLDKGLYPNAFCKITPDFQENAKDWCTVIHSDGSGTKSILAYLQYKESGDPTVFRGISQDSIVMNLDDMLCVGATEGILMSSTINRNAKVCGQEVIQALIEGNGAFLQSMRDLGVDLINGGGETADMGDVIRTVAVDTCAVARMKREDVIADGIVPGLSIVGLSSTGKASYEDRENSGIGSNGLTSARHDLLNSYYKDKYSEAFAPEVDPNYVYCGPYRLEDSLPGSPLKVGEALLSPTRSYAPIIIKLLRENRAIVKGLIHCTGGAQTKCMRFGNRVHFVKDNLFKTPPLFQEIQKASHTTDQEMYQVYNMGHRMEVYCAPSDVAEVIRVAEGFQIEAKEIGRTEASQKSGINHLTIKTESGVLTY